MMLQKLEDGGGAITAPASADTAGASAQPVRNAMTCDVEDYFQVQAFAGHIARDSWDGFASRVERNTSRVLDVGSSRVDLQACKLEYSIVSPK